MAFDENIKKRNLSVLFKFNGELNVLVPAIEIRKKLNSGVLIAGFQCHVIQNKNQNYPIDKVQILRKGRR